MSFEKKVVVVTGASSGIGAATAISFAKAGANVVLVGRNTEKLQKVTEECRQTGNEPLSIIADVTDEEAAKRIVDETIGKFGKIDVLVNNAGLVRYTSVLDPEILKTYDLIVNTNLRAVVHMTHLAASHLIKTKGNIVNISSIAGKMIPSPYSTLYCISKAGLDHFTRGVAQELASHGVRVNSVSPGPVKTDIASNAGFEMNIEEFVKSLPLRRISEPEEIADIVLFLASDKAVAITGSDYVSDNGFMMKR